MNILDLTLDQGESGILTIPITDDPTDAYIEWSVWLRPGRDILFKDNLDAGGLTVSNDKANVKIAITTDNSSSLDPIDYNYEMWFTVNTDRFLVYTGKLSVTRHNVADSLDVFTSADDIRGLLGVTGDVPTVILLNADAWVRAKARSLGVSIPLIPQSTEGMRLAGAMIGCAFVIRSHESDKSWWNSISIAGVSGTMGDAAQRWEAAALDVIKTMAETVQPLFKATTYDDQNFEYS